MLAREGRYILGHFKDDSFCTGDVMEKCFLSAKEDVISGLYRCLFVAGDKWAVGWFLFLFRRRGCGRCCRGGRGGIGLSLFLSFILNRDKGGIVFIGVCDFGFNFCEYS